MIPDLSKRDRDAANGFDARPAFQALRFALYAEGIVIASILFAVGAVLLQIGEKMQ